MGREEYGIFECKECGCAVHIGYMERLTECPNCGGMRFKK